MTERMDARFAAALREVLVNQVTSAPRSASWLARQRRKLTVGAGIAAVAIGGGGIAYGTGVFTTSIPGGTVTTPQGATHAYSATGTHRVSLGHRPAEANAVSIALYCLTPGTFVYPDGASETCTTRQDIRSARHTTVPYSVRLAPGQSAVTIKATPGARWQMTARYVTLTDTAWRFNASGQSYGQPNQDGTPDLVAVRANNGRTGYAYASQLQGPMPKNPKQAAAMSRHPHAYVITVYTSDGKTAIGTFISGAGVKRTTITVTGPGTTPVQPIQPSSP